MGMGMAMSGRRLQQLERLDQLRDQFRRRLEAKSGKITSSTSPPARRISPSPMAAGGGESKDPLKEMKSQASKIMEDLYQTEVLDKKQRQKEVALEVGHLMEKLYKEQQQQLKEKSKRSIIRPPEGPLNPRLKQVDDLKRCNLATGLVYKSSVVALAFVDLWVSILEHKQSWSDECVEALICETKSRSVIFGPVASTVASSLARHMIFLLNEEEGRDLSDNTQSCAINKCSKNSLYSSQNGCYLQNEGRRFIVEVGTFQVDACQVAFRQVGGPFQVASRQGGSYPDAGAYPGAASRASRAAAYQVASRAFQEEASPASFPSAAGWRRQRVARVCRL